MFELNDFLKDRTLQSMIEDTVRHRIYDLAKAEVERAFSDNPNWRQQLETMVRKAAEKTFAEMFADKRI